MRNIFIGILCLVVLSACGTSATLVMEPLKESYSASGLSVEQAQNNVDVPDEISSRLDSKIKEGIYTEAGYLRNNDLILEYKFLQQDKGNQFNRWFFGGIGNAGEASLTVQVIYKDREGNQLAKTQVTGKIGSGFFGGSFNEAIDKAAKEIVEYTTTHFPQN
jgi:hypothetical protein